MAAAIKMTLENSAGIFLKAKIELFSSFKTMARLFLDLLTKLTGADLLVIPRIPE